MSAAHYSIVQTICILVIVLCFTIIAGVSFHSVEEIHYVKKFYPKTFTVEEARDAAIVELIKVFFVSFPLLLIIVLCSHVSKHCKKPPRQHRR